jgi:hypothetical protein
MATRINGISLFFPEGDDKGHPFSKERKLLVPGELSTGCYRAPTICFWKPYFT